MRFRGVILILLIGLFCTSVLSCEEQSQGSILSTVSQAPKVNPATVNAEPIYTLDPGKLAKAKTLTRMRILDYLGVTTWIAIALLFLLNFGVFGKLRDFARRVTLRTGLQGFIVLPLFIAILSTLPLPFEIYDQYLRRSYGLSVQTWNSWAWDWSKALLIGCVGGTLVFSLLFLIMRRSPRRWWFWTWVASIPILIIVIFITPLLLDPLFNRFQPLQKSDPSLVSQLERVVAKGGLAIPPSRMYLMDASTKVTTINAYVTGLGSSARVVVWDTALQKATPDMVLWIFGHEMGHYVLHHVRNTIVFLSLVLLLVYWSGERISRWLIARWGTRWHVRSEQDWAAFGVYALVLTVFGYVLTPCLNTYSRMHEHDADVYSMEAMHGILPDPQASGVRSFKLLGDQSLSDPNPSSWVVWFLYSHPSISQRGAFASSYNPWSPEQTPRYFKRTQE
jgi:STE24 endopeptidase